MRVSYFDFQVERATWMLFADVTEREISRPHIPLVLALELPGKVEVEDDDEDEQENSFCNARVMWPPSQRSFITACDPEVARTPASTASRRERLVR
jgi:hypothetical protein